MSRKNTTVSAPAPANATTVATENRNCTAGLTCLSDASSAAMVATLNADDQVIRFSKSREFFEPSPGDTGFPSGLTLESTRQGITRTAGVNAPGAFEPKFQFALWR